MNTPITIHLIPNAHLDPVWLWDWREGYTEAITTSRTILDLLDEFPELTFIRGEAFVYRYIEQTDPQTFQRICQMIDQGRWEVVGGTMLQSDMNIPATETMLRQLLYAQRYFQSRFGLLARAGWSADCFGHAAPLPDLLAAGGLEYYAYTRPSHVPPVNTFWWEGPAGARLLVHHPTVGWYGTERDELPRRLDQLTEQATRGVLEKNVACFMGLGDHGGHPTRRMILEARQWADQHPEVNLIYSGLTGFFDALRAEISQTGSKEVPVIRGELNFAPRGVYAANARFKFAFRKAEAAVSRAERVSSAIAASTGTRPFDLHDAWEAVLFNTFHDILPGSSIERCYDEQHDWLGTAPHLARQAELHAFNSISNRIDTRVKTPAADMPSGVPLLAFNPHPWPYHGYLEVEVGLDYRPIWKYRDHPHDLPVVIRNAVGKALPLQVIPAENLYVPELNIRTRAVIPVHLAPFGWQLLEFAYEEDAPKVSLENPVTSTETSICNGIWEVKVTKGDEGVQLIRDGKAVFDLPGLSLQTVEDPWGIWGDFNDSPESLSLTEVRQQWTVTRVERGECGPLRATLNVRMEGGHSRVDFCFILASGRDGVDVRTRVYWDERCARLKLVLPGGYQKASYDVVGGHVKRGSVGEVPGGRWVSLFGDHQPIGFASNALYGFNLTPEGSLQASIVRATRYAAEGRATPEEHPWAAVLETGEFRFNFLLTTHIDTLPNLAAELEQPPLLSPVSPSAGDWGRSGSLLQLAPNTVRLVALKPAEDGAGWVLQIQSSEAKTISPELTWLGQSISLPALAPYQLATLRLDLKAEGSWKVSLNHLLEQG